jgi:uncharacterized protein (DUF697 family)
MHNLNNEFNESEFEMYELNPEYLGEYNQESENSYEYQGEISSLEGTFSEASQMELASELLSVSNEAELDRFLGGLFKKAVGGVGSFLKSGAGRALGGVLKGLAKKALPMAGAALGSAFLPGVGTAIGGALGRAASNMFELELEGLSQEDAEFETARAFIRFAGNAARQAISTPPDQPAEEIARRSVISSARRYAPGLLIRRGSYSGRGYYPGRRNYYQGRRNFFQGGRNYYHHRRPSYPGSNYAGAGYNTGAVDNVGAGVNTGGGAGASAGMGDNAGAPDNSSFLTEKIRRLEEMVRNLSSQLQPPPPAMSGGNGNAAPPEKEMYEYW